MRLFNGRTAGRSLAKLMFGGLLAVGLLCGPSALAVTDYVFFSVNGDTTLTAMTQGDTIGWGANCDTASMVYWEIWLDLDVDSVIDLSDDFQVASFTVTDGDTTSDGPEGDSSPIPDGYYVGNPFILGVAPGNYIFTAMDLADSTSAQRIMVCSALPMPPNQFTGHITVPGHPAPDSAVLLNVWVECEPDGDDGQFWTALTDDSGYFEINVGSVGTGLTFYVQPTDIDGFVTPAGQLHVASGVVADVDFDYTIPADSVYGSIKDDLDSLIKTGVWVYAQPRFDGPDERETQSFDGTYVINFGATELGDWLIGLNWENLIPNYLVPDAYEFNNDTISEIMHDFVCPRTDTMLYARITESGALPANRYRILAGSNALSVSTTEISNTGSDNVVELSISSADASGWVVNVADWDDNYPIPAGFILEGTTTTTYSPGDTVDLNFITGNMVSDTIFVDPGDGPPVWNDVWVNLSDMGRNYGANPDGIGVFTIYADTGTFNLNVNADGYLVNPVSRTVEVTSDTTGGLDFEINYAHCRVHGTLTNVDLPLDPGTFVYAWTGSGSGIDGYQVWAEVDTLTGMYTMQLCDGDWVIEPPFVVDREEPDSVELTIGEIPDTVQTVDLAYSLITAVGDEEDGLLPLSFSLSQNYPNPFNPETVIEFNLPSRSSVELSVYNLLGQKVAVLVSDELPAGPHTIRWNGIDDTGNSVSTGVYLYRLQAGEQVQSRKMLMLK